MNMDDIRTNLAVQYDIKTELIGKWLWCENPKKKDIKTLQDYGFKWTEKKKAFYLSPFNKPKKEETLDDLRQLFNRALTK